MNVMFLLRFLLFNDFFVGNLFTSEKHVLKTNEFSWFDMLLKWVVVKLTRLDFVVL